ncbi:CdaR family protein [Prevotella lacticifex]|jgi:hypothetical protein|uniref:CdaR family protein n=1 Tax=Prevotella lacticifex TaxID=2854755 RepID=UPI001CC37C43|nr:YbbR-like domain-containing protein [Prevotella lacticifex]
MGFRLSEVYDACRRFLRRIISREFLVFLFFLFLSGSFWLIITLNETYEREVTLRIELTNVPRNAVITTDVSDTIHAVVRDKGYMIATYLYGNHFTPIRLNFQQYADGKGHGTIPVADIQKYINQQLYGSTKLVSVKSDNIEFYYNYGERKRVPVRLLGNVNPGSTYYLAQTQFTPDSVTVYAAPGELDNIRAAYTVRQNINGLSSPRTMRMALRKIKGAKFEPDVVTVRLFPDVLTEEVVEVPIEPINVPKDKVLRIFPPKIGVKFVVGVNQLRAMPKDEVTKALLPKGFKVIVDYKEIETKGGDRCHIYVGASPANVRNARPVTDEVDYLIETR